MFNTMPRRVRGREGIQARDSDKHPQSDSMLERYRLDARKQQRCGTIGSHVMRRRGQSLEFREFLPYMLGDDIRQVDWRASARYGSEDDLLVRHFVAEEQLTIAISLDLRESMWLPTLLPKARVALWLAESLAWIALRNKERVFLHSLFGQGVTGMAELKGSLGRRRIQQQLRAYATGAQRTHSSATDRLNLGLIEKKLQPAGIWVIISDLYFMPSPREAERPRTGEAGTTTAQTETESVHSASVANTLAGCIKRMHDGMRWIMVVDLDSWPYERTLVKPEGENTAYAITGPGVSMPKEGQVTDNVLGQAFDAIEASKSRFRHLAGIRALDMTAFRWPDQPKLASFDGPEFFRSEFEKNAVIKKLFMKDSWNH